MNLQVSIPPIEEAPVPPADEVARALSAAKLSDEGALLDAIDARRIQLCLSNATLEQISGLAVGHIAKVCGPSRLKSPSAKTLYAVLDAVGLSLVLVIDGAKAARISPSWRQRDASHVRARPPSPVAVAKSRPIVLAELARKASRGRYRTMPAPMFLKALMQEMDA
jgi:transcriptional regulator with XRE-family HTH domain